ncbi:MAG: hypothetical protein E3K32_01225 [wastewater metagenome]|nr:hypothetical protein [Candidatus Loosdrechtia aerotolerans]
MRTIFGIFKKYADAQAAVQDLQEKEFNVNEMNAIVQKDIAEEYMNVNPRKVNTATMKGIDQLLAGVLAGKQIVNTHDAGRVYASGSLATELAKVAESPQAAGKGLKRALVTFNIPEEVAEAFVAGIRGGGVFFCIRTSNERSSEAANVLRFYKGEYVSSYSK